MLVRSLGCENLSTGMYGHQVNQVSFILMVLLSICLNFFLWESEELKVCLTLTVLCHLLLKSEEE